MDLVIFPNTNAFALRENVFCWTDGVDREFSRRFRVSVKDFVGMTMDMDGKLKAIYLWNANVTPMTLETMVIMRSAHTMDAFVVMKRHQNVIHCMRTVQRLWRAWVRRREVWLTVMMALHPRLGKESWLFELDAGVMQICLRYV